MEKQAKRIVRSMPRLSCTISAEDLNFLNRVAMRLSLHEKKPITISRSLRFLIDISRNSENILIKDLEFYE